MQSTKTTAALCCHAVLDKIIFNYDRYFKSQKQSRLLKINTIINIHKLFPDSH